MGRWYVRYWKPKYLSTWSYSINAEINDEVGRGKRDLEQAEALREETIEWLRSYLGATPSTTSESGMENERKEVFQMKPSSDIISFFEVIGEEVRSVFTFGMLLNVLLQSLLAHAHWGRKQRFTNVDMMSRAKTNTIKRTRVLYTDFWSRAKEETRAKPPIHCRLYYLSYGFKRCGRHSSFCWVC